MHALDREFQNVGRMSCEVRELTGCGAGLRLIHTSASKSTKSQSRQGFKVVGGTGFEPVTPTMSR